MKKIWIVLCVLSLVLAFAGCQKKHVQPVQESSAASAMESSAPRSQPEEPTPEQAIAELLTEMKALDEQTASAYLAELTGKAELPQAYGKLIVPMVQRLDIQAGNSKITGDTAMLDVSVTALDAKSLLSSVLLQSAVFLSANKDNPDAHAQLAEMLAEQLDFAAATTITTNSTVYLVKGADGAWKIDLNNKENLGFLNAVTGGAVEIAESVRELGQLGQ